MKRYYVYLLLDPRCDNQPFYVGKGCRDRAKQHLYETEGSTENLRKFRKIRKIREAGLEPVIQYYATDLAEDDAYDLEAALILQYGRAKIDEGGILTNICIDRRPPDNTGKPRSKETASKIGDAQRGEKSHRYGVPWSDDEKQRRSAWAKDKGVKPPVRSGPMTQEQKDAIGQGNTGKKRTPEQSAYLSSIRKGKTRKPCRADVADKIRCGNIKAKSGTTLPDDLTGMQFGKWTVIQRGADRRDRKTRGASGLLWVCRSGETEREISLRDLVRTHTRQRKRRTKIT